MKTFLIAAGILMTGASVYGVVDYNKKSHTKEFNELYKKEEPKKEVQQADAKTTELTLGTSQTKESLKTEDKISKTDESLKPETVIKKKRKFDIREFSRAPLKDK